MSTLRLMLVRHGETASNIKGSLDSLPPGPPLTERGRRQATDFAAAVAIEPLVAVYASVALRAQQTAEPVAKAHGLDVTVVEGVHEVFCGDLEGRADRESVATFNRTVASWMAGELEVALPGGESGAAVRLRYLAAVEAIRRRHVDGTVVLVSHGGAIRLAGAWLAGNVEGRLADVGVLPNTGRVVLEAAGESGWHCLEWTGVPLG